MYHSDLNVNAAVERSVERRRAVQAYGATSVEPVRWVALALGVTSVVAFLVLVLPAFA